MIYLDFLTLLLWLCERDYCVNNVWRLEICSHQAGSTTLTSHNAVMITAHQASLHKCLGRKMRWKTQKLSGRRRDTSNSFSFPTFSKGLHLGWAINTWFLGAWSLESTKWLLYLIGSQRSFWILSQDPPLSSTSCQLFTASFPQLSLHSPPEAPRCLENLPCEITSNFIHLEKVPSSGTFLPGTSVIWPPLPESNGITLWMWNLTYPGEVLGIGKVVFW